MCVDIKVNTNIINLQKSLADKFTLPNAEEKTSGLSYWEKICWQHYLQFPKSLQRQKFLVEGLCLIKEHKKFTEKEDPYRQKTK